MAVEPTPGLPAYAELRCVSTFSFLLGASQPEELVERAKTMGYSALALTDECSMAGIVRAHVAAQRVGLKLLVGSQFRVEVQEGDEAGPFNLVVLACNLNGYGNLCEFITALRRNAPKGTYRLRLQDLATAVLDDCVVVASPLRGATPAQLLGLARWLLARFTGRCWLGVELPRQLDDEMWLYRLREASELSAIPLVAVGDVYMHVRSRKPLARCDDGHPHRSAAHRVRTAICRSMPSGICARACACPRPSLQTCWRRRCRWLSAAASR